MWPKKRSSAALWLVYGHVWPSEEAADYLTGQETFDHPKDLSIRHLFPSYWAKEGVHHGEKLAERIALAAETAEVGSESGHHVTSHIEEYHHPVYVTKAFHRSLDSQLVVSAVPALILTVLTFPLTLTLLFFIVKQLVNIQAVFNQNLVNQMGSSEGHGRLSLNSKLNNAATTLDKALDKYKVDE
ncbi:hypothetical protein TYRP_004694 [Tyrophagus putrescentiae]|nr:hypothetical protein TYRP_004694 [Tyrophagus putrescentiae]